MLSVNRAQSAANMWSAQWEMVRRNPRYTKLVSHAEFLVDNRNNVVVATFTLRRDGLHLRGIIEQPTPNATKDEWCANLYLVEDPTRQPEMILTASLHWWLEHYHDRLDELGAMDNRLVADRAYQARIAPFQQQLTGVRDGDDELRAMLRPELQFEILADGSALIHVVTASEHRLFFVVSANAPCNARMSVQLKYPPNLEQQGYVPENLDEDIVDGNLGALLLSKRQALLGLFDFAN